MREIENEFKDSSLFEISDLIGEYLGGELSSEQQARLDEWLNDDEGNRVLFESICSKATINSKFKSYKDNDSYSAYLRFAARRKTQQTYYFIRIVGTVAAVLALLFAGMLLLNKPMEVDHLAQLDTEAVEEIEKASPNKPILKKYTGEEVVIDSSGYIAEYADENLTAQLEEQAQSKSNLETVYNEMFVPSKCDFYFTMNDGTKVWMNANSSVRYPVLFAKNERTIYVSGEVYLEVFEDASRPFYVEMEGMRVAVLGTSFNVRAYPNESSQFVTLVEGKVKATIQTRDYNLTPGKQLTHVTDLNGINGVSIATVNVDDITAWKRGYYVFKKSSLLEVASTLQNWYDMDIVFNTQQSREIKYTGVIYKDEPIEAFVNRLRAVSSVRCVIKENKLYIY